MPLIMYQLSPLWILAILSSTSAAANPLLFPNNENHIFNAIHASMRQWDSSYHHNGMSFFLATIPEDTEVYHTELRNASITGMKWLGLEPELPLDCLAGSLQPGGAPPDVRPPDEDDSSVSGNQQMPLQLSRNVDTHDNEPGTLAGGRAPYFHTYRTSRDLRLLYIDGQSASKTLNGTLDSTDRLLLDDLLAGDPINVDRQRGAALCDLWPADKIDGFIRMEEGFEIILCASERVLQLQSVLQTDGYAQLDDLGEALWQSVFSDIRPDIILDYDSMITAYSSKYAIDLFDPETRHKGLPRLKNMTGDQRAAVMRDLDAVVLSPHKAGLQTLNWQRIANDIVSRYTTELKYIVSHVWSSKGDLDRDLHHFLRRHVDVRFDDRKADIDRCASMYLPRHYEHSTASTAIEAVTRTVCTELFDAMDDRSLPSALDRVRVLMDELGWSAFKYCGGCQGKEICFLPQWFLGGREDRDHPRCRNYSDYSRRTDYWGELGRERT